MEIADHGLPLGQNFISILTRLPQGTPIRMIQKDVRPPSWKALLGASGAYYAGAIFSSVAYRGPIKRAMLEAQTASHGWVTLQWVFPMVTLIVALFVAHRVCGLRRGDLGLHSSSAALGILGAAAFALTMQLAVQADPGLHVSAPQREEFCGSGAAFGILVDQLLGNALVEEVFFRGYVLRYIFLLTSPTLGGWLSTLVAFLGSLALFVLSHMPLLWIGGNFDGLDTATRALWLLEFGAVLTITYLVTNNLYLCIGLHAIYNSRFVLFHAPMKQVEAAWWGLFPALLIGWWWFAKGPRKNNFAEGGRERT